MRLLKLVAITGWICVANTEKMFSQTTAIKNRDTIFIHPSPTINVLLLGDKLNSLFHYQRIDSLVNLFLTDKAAATEKGLGVEARTTHYIVHPSGKRRFKSENEDFQEAQFNLQSEIIKMNNNLPAYGYIIYDVATGNEIQIYVANPDQLSQLRTINFSGLLKEQDLKKSLSKKTSSYKIEQQNGSWSGATRKFAPKDFIEINPLFGVSIIGSQLSPETGLRIFLSQSNRYGYLKWAFGASYTFNILSDFRRGDFNSISVLRTANVLFLRRNADVAEDALWKTVGVQAGWVHLSPGLLNNSIRVGIFTNYHNFQIGFHTYFLNKSAKSSVSAMYGLSFSF